jgi:histidine triad (HIT) family protein
MTNKDCIFCKIVRGKIPSVKIWEDKENIAILDIKPNVEGMTIIVPKKHYESDIFEMEDDIYQKFMASAKRVAKILEKGLKVKRVAMVIEGMEINHAHIKLYPLHGLENKFKEMIAKEKVYFNKYPGYITTLEGPEKSLEELKKTAKKIRGE